MTRYLMLPVQLDLLRLNEPTRVVEAMADFSRLPYFDGEGDANADTAYVSENLLSQPLENRNLILQAGVHLHWTLPRALTRSQHTGDDVDFPTVPNRWLVTRHGPADARRRWLVESDYLYPADREGMKRGIEAGAICYPMHAPTPGQPPFRYMGRALKEEEWGKDRSNDQYLPYPLTAVGYGQPLFAAFYPNCRTVFGFHDALDDLGDEQAPAAPPADEEALANISYSVIGWYDHPGDDPCAAGLNAIYLREQYGWQIGEKKETPDDPPERLLCWATCSFEDALTAAEQPEKETAEIVVGNSATEALSAYLAHHDHSGDDEARRILEDRLEALHLAPLLDHRRVDTGPKFREARHEKAFASVHGGHLWRVRALSAGGGREGHRHSQAEITLPPQLASGLNQLNRLQQRLDAVSFKLESWRERIFADWYRYQLSAYPPIGEAGDYPHPDHVRYFIEKHDLEPFRALEAEHGKLQEQVAALRERLAQQLADLQRFTQADLQNVEAFLAQVKQRPEAALAPLRELLPSTGGNGDAPDRALLVRRLNGLLQRADLRQQLSFVGEPPAEARKIAQAARPLSPAQVLRYNRLLLQSLFPALGRRARYVLQQAPGPRFYQPHEPVLLLAGPAVETTDRHPLGREVACRLLEIDGPLPQALSEPELAPADLEGAETEGRASQPNWRPLFMEWQVVYCPVGDEERPPSATGYDPDFLRERYLLAENGVELKPRPAAQYEAGRYLYSGRSILTGQALPLLCQWIDDYLRQRLLPAYYEAHDIPDEERKPAVFDEKRETVLAWYEATAAEKDPFTDELLRIERLLDSPDLHIQAQALSGFSAALLGHKQTMQLPVDSPLAFAAYHPFVEEVRRAVGRHNRIAPQPANGFHPLRAGALELAELRLVNSFGLVRDVPVDQVLATDVMFNSDKPKQVWLPPRLAQPARLNWRWLSADDDQIEMNSHPATTPVCGWLVPNNLDGSLLVYDGAGEALGILSWNDRWRPAPGAASAVDGPNQIANLHLQRVVRWLLAGEEGLLQSFISALDSALENIDPDGFARHEARALLMGRPLAVVRATLGLEQRGLPALNQDWNLFRESLASGRPDAAGVGQLHVPVRLGEHRQLNDGLAGYWLENDQGALSSHFYSPQAAAFTSETIVTYEEQREGDKSAGDPRLPPLPIAIDDPPQALTLLVDPRGDVHATSGLLPTAALAIPPEQYAEALAALELNFRAMPILAARLPGQDTPVIRLPLPPEPGYTWSWVEQEAGGNWLELGEIEPPQQGHYEGSQTLREGWLRLRAVPASEQTEDENGQD